MDGIDILYRLATGRSVTNNDLVKVGVRIDTIARVLVRSKWMYRSMV
ncbi:hypothetical protein [Vulcanisaeta distributa]|nr:hypothetical protein [Vulcanisaeta distributa]